MAIIKRSLGNNRQVIIDCFREIYSGGLGGLAFSAFYNGWACAWDECIAQSPKLKTERIKELEGNLDAECRVSQMLLADKRKQDKRIKQLEGEEPIPFSWWSGCPKLAQKAMERIIGRNDELEAKLEQHRWIPVSKRLPEKGKCLVLCEGKILEVKVRVSEDEWEDAEGKSFLQETASCDIEYLGCILIGHDDCITHWKPIILPKTEAGS